LSWRRIGAIFSEKLVFGIFVFCDFVYIIRILKRGTVDYFNIVVERFYITKLYM